MPLSHLNHCSTLQLCRFWWNAHLPSIQTGKHVLHEPEPNARYLFITSIQCLKKISQPHLSEVSCHIFSLWTLTARVNVFSCQHFGTLHRLLSTGVGFASNIKMGNAFVVNAETFAVRNINPHTLKAYKKNSFTHKLWTNESFDQIKTALQRERA